MERTARPADATSITPRWFSRPATYFAAVALLGAAVACSTPQSRMRRDLGWLASDELAGRKAGSPQAEDAASWIASRFRSLGLTPAGEQGTYLQRFTLPPARRVARSPRIDVTPQGAPARSLELGAGMLALLASTPGSASGSLLDVGPATSPQFGAGEFAAAAAHRPVIAWVHFDPAALPADTSASGPHGGVAVPTVRTLAFQARQAGAKGLVLSVPDLSKLPKETGEERDVALPVVALTEAAAARLAKEAGGASIAIDPGIEAVPRSTPNVLGLVPGSDPNGEIVVIGAHFDHLGHGGADSLAPGSTAIHYGADDNASGTTLLLELARRVTKREKPLRRTLLFAAWGGEEMGLLGSAHWVKNPTVPLGRVAANLNFDMVGRSTDRKLDVGSTTSSSVWERVVTESNQKLTIPLNVRMSKSQRGVGGSDHMSFLGAGKPALFFFTGLHEDYHKPTDTADKIAFLTLEEIVDLAERTAERLDVEPVIDFVKPPDPPATSGPASQGAEQGLRAWLGSIPDYGAEDGGVVLSGTSAGSPAERAGMKKGDVLKRLGSYKIENIDDLTMALGRLKPGEEVEIEFRRDGEMKTLKLVLGRRR